MYLINNNEIKRKKIKKILLIILIIFSIWVGFGLYINLTSKEKKQLEKIGYSNIEISIIQDILSNKDIKNIYKYNYMKSLTDILVSDDFNSKKLINYIDYYNKYPTISNKDLIFIINNDLDELVYNDFTKELMHHKSFKEDRMNRYNDYKNKYNLELDDVVFAVNNDFDLYNIKYKKSYKKYMKRNYYIIANTERYEKYSDKNNYLDIDEVIAHVNTNKDINKVYKANTKLNNTILVNKYYYLDKEYIPNNLVDINESDGNGKIDKDAYEAFKKLNINSTINNNPLYIINSYISYEEQNKLYISNYKYFDKPGYSENQTGLLIEIQNNEWLENNAYKYGFIQRYPKDKKDITGYYRPNIYRYVGNEISEFIHKYNISYEEYYAYFIEKNK